MPLNLANAESFESEGVFPYFWAGRAEPVLDGLWLIDNWLPKCGVAAIYGHSGSGKSFLAMDMALHVAKGVEWAGKRVQHGLVFYVVAEGQVGFVNRLGAYRQEHGLAPDAPFVFITTPVDMQALDGDTRKVSATLRHASNAAGVDPAMIVFDTLSKTFGSGKENTDDMATYVANCQRVASSFECLSVIVHHRPKDSESRDLRGHSSLRAGLDTAILVEAGAVKTATTIKQKDGPDNEQVHFELEQVSIGTNRHDDDVTTCLVRITDQPARAAMDPRTKARRSLKGNKLIGLRAIEGTVAAFGVEPPIDIPKVAIDRFSTWHAVRLGQVSDRLKQELLATSSGDVDKKPDSVRRAADRVITDLKSLKIIGTWGDWVWIN